MKPKIFPGFVYRVFVTTMVAYRFFKGLRGLMILYAYEREIRSLYAQDAYVSSENRVRNGEREISTK